MKYWLEFLMLLDEVAIAQGIDGTPEYNALYRAMYDKLSAEAEAKEQQDQADAESKLYYDRMK